MEIRQTINDNPRIAGGVTAGIVLLALIFIIWQTLSGGAGGGSGAVPQAFFTVDDGRTYFTDDVTHVPPFKTSDGKIAYRAVVVRCGTETPFVSYLEKFSDADQKDLENGLNDSKTYSATVDALFTTFDSRIIVKKPLTGDKGWVAATVQTAKQYEAVKETRCPDGTAAQMVPAQTASPK